MLMTGEITSDAFQSVMLETDWHLFVSADEI